MHIDRHIDCLWICRHSVYRMAYDPRFSCDHRNCRALSQLSVQWVFTTRPEKDIDVDLEPKTHLKIHPLVQEEYLGWLAFIVLIVAVFLAGRKIYRIRQQ